MPASFGSWSTAMKLRPATAAATPGVEPHADDEPGRCEALHHRGEGLRRLEQIDQGAPRVP